MVHTLKHLFSCPKGMVLCPGNGEELLLRRSHHAVTHNQCQYLPCSSRIDLFSSLPSFSFPSRPFGVMKRHPCKHPRSSAFSFIRAAKPLTLPALQLRPRHCCRIPALGAYSRSPRRGSFSPSLTPGGLWAGKPLSGKLSQTPPHLPAPGPGHTL